MKKYISVFELFLRSSFYKCLFVLIMSGAIQTLIFYMTLPFGSDVRLMLGFELMLSQSHVAIVFGIAFIVLCILLCRTGCNSSSRCSYTLCRLRITEKATLACQTVYNCMIFILLLITEAAVCVLMFKLYSYRCNSKFLLADFLNNQTFFIATLRSSLLNSVLPLNSIFKTVRNIIFVLCMGFLCATFPYFQRRGSARVEPLLLGLFIIMNFLGLQLSIVFSVIAYLVSAAITLIAILRLKRAPKEKKKAQPTVQPYGNANTQATIPSPYTQDDTQQTEDVSKEKPADIEKSPADISVLYPYSTANRKQNKKEADSSDKKA